MNDTIVFLDSESTRSGSWAYFVQRFKLCGFKCHVLSLPGESNDDNRGRKAGNNQSSENKFCVEDAIKYYLREIEAYSAPPIIIGHSVDGLIVQLMLGRGVGSLGVAISPVPTGPILRRWGALRRHLRWNRRQPSPRRHRPASFEKLIAPVPYGTDNRAPLLLISVGRDPFSPPFVVKHIFRRYRASAADTYYKNFPKGSHGLIGEKEEKEVVDFIIQWIHGQSFVPV